MKTLFFALLILGFVFVNCAPVVEKVESGPENMFLRFDTLPDQEDIAFDPQPKQPWIRLG